MPPRMSEGAVTMRASDESFLELSVEESPETVILIGAEETRSFAS